MAKLFETKSWNNSALPTAIIGSLKVSNSEGAVVKTGVANFPPLRYLHLILDNLNDFYELVSKIKKKIILDDFCESAQWSISRILRWLLQKSEVSNIQFIHCLHGS